MENYQYNAKQLIEELQKEVERKQLITNAVYEKIHKCSLKFLLNSNLTREDKEIFKEIFKDFLL